MHVTVIELEGVLPCEELSALARVNTTASTLESVMRLRALAELSSRMDTETLIALAEVVERAPEALGHFVAALAANPSAD